MRAPLLLSFLLLGGLACKQNKDAPEPPAGGGASAAPATAPAEAPAAAPDAPAEPASAPAEPGQPVPAFELEGTRFGEGGAAEPVVVSSRGAERPRAYVFIGTRCSTTAKYLERLSALEEEFGSKVDFVFVYPNKTDPVEERAAFHQQHGMKGPMVHDPGARVARMLGRERTAEVVLVGKDGVIAYAGAIDDNKDEAQVTRRHLALALGEHLAGKPVSQPKSVGSA